MAPRAFWKGYLRLQAEKTHFHQINRRTGSRLRQQLVDEETGKVVEKEDKAWGYELSKGRSVHGRSAIRIFRRVTPNKEGPGGTRALIAEVKKPKLRRSVFRNHRAPVEPVVHANLDDLLRVAD
jgi:hypothetical protein